MNAIETAESVERARQGDREGLAGLYRAFGPRVLGLCRHILGSAEATEDARSEVFLRLPRAIARYDPALPFDRWLLSVASHHCLDVLRRRRLESRLFASELDEAAGDTAGSETGPSPLAAVLTDEGRARVRDALVRLPERYRIALDLLVLPGLVVGSADGVRRWGRSLGWGVVSLVGGPIAIVLLAVTVVGLPLALVLLGFYLLGLYAAKVVVGLALGWALLRPRGHARRDALRALVVGLALVTLATTLPLVGWPIWGMVACLGAGALAWRLAQATGVVRSSEP